MRINELENDIHQRYTKEEVKEIIADKYDPIKEDLQELKEKIDKIFDRLLSK